MVLAVCGDLRTVRERRRRAPPDKGGSGSHCNAFWQLKIRSHSIPSSRVPTLLFLFLRRRSLSPARCATFARNRRRPACLESSLLLQLNFIVDVRYIEYDVSKIEYGSAALQNEKMEVRCTIFPNVSMDQAPYFLFEIETSCVSNYFKHCSHYDLCYFEIESGQALSHFTFIWEYPSLRTYAVFNLENLLFSFS